MSISKSGEESITTEELKKEIQLPVNLRDYFAAKAMSGMPSSWTTFEDLAKRAYALADAMIEERNK